MSPKALLFDFDGILLDTEWAIYQTYVSLFKKHGHELPLSTYVQCIGSDFQTWSPEKHLEELTGKSFDWPTINEERQVEIRRNIEVLDAMAGARDLLTHCHEIKLPCAVVSSSSRDWVGGWLDKLDLTKDFVEIICRGDAPRIKPAPDLYLEGVKRMKLPAAECMVIEDSLNGMLAAHEAGCPVVAIPNRITEVIDFSKAEYCFETLYGVLDLIKAQPASS